MKKTLPDVPEELNAAIQDLKLFLANNQNLTLECVAVAPGQIDAWRHHFRLSPSYLAFVSKFGLLSVRSLSFGQTGIIGFFEPENLESEGLHVASFQRMLDDNVADFYCFNPLVDLGEGELEVVRCFHDEKFVLATTLSNHSVGFNEHLLWVISQFMENYQDY